MEVTEIALAIIPIVLMLGVGILLKKFKILRVEDTVVINKIILYGTLPAFAFLAVFRQSIPARMIQVPVMAIAVTFMVMGIAWLVARLFKLDRPTTGGLILAASFGNTGFLGYPVVSAAYPPGLGTAVIFDNFGMALPLNSVGVSVAAHTGGEKPDWRHFLTFIKLPAFGATILALLLRRYAPNSVPSVLLHSLEYLMQATVPLAMVSLGLILSWEEVKGSRATVLIACILKLLVFPALMFLMLKFFPLPEPLRRATLFESSMPPAVMASVIASQYRANGHFVSAAVVICTLLSVITMPLIIVYAG